MLKFLRNDGYIRLFKSIINQFGIVKVNEDANFDNFKVTNGSANGTIQIAQDSYAVDDDINIIYQEAANDLAIPSDSAWYWVKIAHNESSVERGTISLSANGNVTGINTEFAKVLRDQNNYPVKVSFPSSSNNTGDYQVVSVLSDTQAVLAGNFVDENNLDYQVVGSFTPGINPAGSVRLPYIYDECTISLEAEASANVAPPKTEGKEFYIARVRNTGAASVEIEDKRTEIFTPASKYTGWVEPVLGSEFTNVSGDEIEYRFDYLGYVEIRGSFSTTSGTATLFTLPESYRPAVTKIGTYSTADGANLGTIIVSINGDVKAGNGYDFSTTLDNRIINLKYQIQ